VSGGRSDQALSSACRTASAGWAPEMPYRPSMTKKGTPLIPYARAGASSARTASDGCRQVVWPHSRPTRLTVRVVCQGDRGRGRTLKEMSRVEQFESIRRDARDGALSIRALADKHRVHRRTVRLALADATPPPRKPPVRLAPVLGPHVATVRAWLIADKAVHRKQRHREDVAAASTTWATAQRAGASVRSNQAACLGRPRSCFAPVGLAPTQQLRRA